MTISDLSVAILREVPEPVDNRQQCALIMLTAEDGTVGYGEANANPAAVKALLETDLGLKGNWDDAPPVSYTHLDVYKRQAYPRAFRL